MKSQKLKLKSQKLALLFLILGTLIFLPLISLAAGLVPCGGKGEPPCQLCHLFLLFKNIVDFLLLPSSLNNNIPLVALIAILFLVIGGSMYMLAYFEVVGDPKWISQAKSLIWAVVIGLIIIYGAWLIINLFFQIIGAEMQKWWEIPCPI